jgi:hypothetical protein
VGAGPGVDAPGTCPAGEGVGCVTDISTLARLTDMASAASGAKRRESAARRVSLLKMGA